MAMILVMTMLMMVPVMLMPIIATANNSGGISESAARPTGTTQISDGRPSPIA